MPFLWYKAKVLPGRRAGRRMHFPTINLPPTQFNSDFQTGVYAAKVRYSGKEYAGALYFGPIYAKTKIVTTLEIFIFNFHETIYGRLIEYQVKKFIRPALEFRNSAELKKQIEKDVRKIKNMKLA